MFTAGDHNYDDNNIHERPLQDVGFFSVAHIYSYMCECIPIMYTNYTNELMSWKE